MVRPNRDRSLRLSCFEPTSSSRLRKSDPRAQRRPEHRGARGDGASGVLQSRALSLRVFPGGSERYRICVDGAKPVRMANLVWAGGRHHLRLCAYGELGVSSRGTRPVSITGAYGGTPAQQPLPRSMGARPEEGSRAHNEGPPQFLSGFGQGASKGHQYSFPGGSAHPASSRFAALVWGTGCHDFGSGAALDPNWSADSAHVSRSQRKGFPILVSTGEAHSTPQGRFRAEGGASDHPGVF